MKLNLILGSYIVALVIQEWNLNFINTQFVDLFHLMKLNLILGSNFVANAWLWGHSGLNLWDKMVQL